MIGLILKMSRNGKRIIQTENKKVFIGYCRGDALTPALSQKETENFYAPVR